MEKNIQESFVGKTLNRKTSEIVPKKLELDEQSFFSLLSEYTDSLGIITNLSNGDIVDTKSESGREFPVVVKKEVKRYLFKPVSGLVGGSFVVSLVVSPYSYFWGKATEIPVFDLDFKVLFYPNNNEIRIGIYVNNYKAKCCRKNGVSYEVVPRHFFRKSDGRFLDKSHDFFRRPQEFFELTKMGVDSDTLEICKNYIKRIADFKVEPEKGVGVLNLSNDSLEDSVIKVQSIFGDELFCLEEKVLESFTKKVSRKNSSELVSDIDYPDGVYILHDTLGVKTVDSWNPKNNNGVVGILVVEGEHKIVVATEDAPEDLSWSKKDKLVNQPIEELEDAESDFNGEMYCRRLNSPDFPAAYYCKTYNKGGRSWYLPSTGELWLICRHLEEIQNALETVGGQKLITTWDEGVKPLYWSSTEGSDTYAWRLYLNDRFLGWTYKVILRCKVRPVSKFDFSTLKESFTRKIRSKKNDELTTKADTAFVSDGVYILHETLGVKGVEGWNPKDNKGVVGILLIEDEHKIVVALKDSPKNLCWSKKRKLVNQPFEDESEKSDFNGEYYCQKLDSPDFPAAYYCKTYNKGGRNWYLPSSGELWLIYQHLEEIQNALSIVGGQRFVTVRGEDTPVYWSSTEDSAMYAWAKGISNIGWCNKIGDRYKVRPVSNFNLSELKESFVKKTRKSNSKEIVQDADDKAFNPVMDAKEFVNRMEECILSYKQPYVYGKKNPYNLEKFSFEMITSWPNTFKFNGHKFNYGSSELLFDVSNSKKPSFRIKLIFFENLNKDDHSRNIICYLTVGPIKPNKEGIYEDLLFQYIYDSNKKRISFAENPEGVRFNDNMESIEPTLRNLNFILNDIRFLMDNWKILYKTYLKKDSFETWNEFYKMLPSQNNKGFDFDLKESFAHKISKKTSGSLKGREMFGEMESFGEFDMLFKRFLKKHENQFSSCFMTNYPFKSKMLGRIGYKVVLKKDCPFEDGSDDRTVLRFTLDVFQRDIMNFPEDQDLNTPHGILTVVFCTELGPSTPQQINLANLEFIGGNESPVDFRFVKFKERREWEKPNFSYQLLFGLERFLMALDETMNNMDEQTWSEIGRTSANFNPFKGEACCGADSKIILDILDNHGFYSELHKNFSKVNLADLNESFTKKVSSKKNSDLISRADSDFVPDGVYILHETLGVRGVEGWNPKFNEGVVGVLVVEDEHQLVVALEDSSHELRWSEEIWERNKLVNQPVENKEEAKSDFNGEVYCRKLNSPDFPAAYYCLNYKKGNRSWYLPSSGELMLIYRHLKEIQTALSIVGGQKLITTWDEGLSWYWTSTEYSVTRAWTLSVDDEYHFGWHNKVSDRDKVRPVSNFRKNTLKESFTKKISSKKNTDLVPDVSYPNGVYIVHETLGIESYLDWKWDPDANKGVIGILVVENEHQIMVSLEDAPEVFKWSEKHKLVNRPKNFNEAESDFDGEEYRKRLNSPDFPASYYCSTYNKGGQNWYLPSLGELRLIYRNLDDIQTALEIVDGQSIVDSWGEGIPVYVSSTEFNTKRVWTLGFEDGFLYNNNDKVNGFNKVRPVSKFKPSELRESFTKKIKNRSSKDLTDNQSFQLENGLYILHETLGVRTVDGWNPKNNKGVVGILLIEDEHKIIVALEDAPEALQWAEVEELVNKPFRIMKYAASDFNGEEYCLNLNSRKFPAAYYCLNYKKGRRSWHLPSSGELWLIYNHLEKIQNALETVGGKKFVSNFNELEGVPGYWSSTETDAPHAWHLYLQDGYLSYRLTKVDNSLKVRPVSNFSQNRNLKESFTKKTTTKGRNEIIGQADNLVVDYENLIKGLIKKYGFSTIHKYVLSLSRGVGYKKPPYVRRHEPFTEDKMVTILGELEFDKSETSDNDITVTWRRAKKFHYRTPIEKTEKFSELPVDEKRDIYKYLINWLNVRIDEDEKIEKMDKLPQPSRNVV